MSRETDRLIADRGYGLSLRQKDVLRGVAAGEVRCNPNWVDEPSWWAGTFRHVKSQTLASLERRGLICRPAWCCTENEAAWELTDDGRALAHRLGYWPVGRAGTGEDQ